MTAPRASSRPPPRAARLALASLVLHALGAAATLALPARSSGLHSADASVVPATLEVLVENAAAVGSEIDREASAEPARVAPRSTRDRRVRVRPPQENVLPESTPGAAAEEWSFRPSGPSTGVESTRPGGGMESDIRTGVAATVRQALREQAARDARRVVPGYTARDVGLGLTPGGELVTASEEAVRKSLAPDVGHAELRFDVNETGAVYAVEVVDASSAWSEWLRAASEVASLAPRLRMPWQARGFAIVVRVESYVCVPPFCAVPTRLVRARITSAQAF